MNRHILVSLTLLSAWSASARAGNNQYNPEGACGYPQPRGITEKAEEVKTWIVSIRERSQAALTAAAEIFVILPVREGASSDGSGRGAPGPRGTTTATPTPRPLIGIPREKDMPLNVFDNALTAAKRAYASAKVSEGGNTLREAEERLAIAMRSKSLKTIPENMRRALLRVAVFESLLAEARSYGDKFKETLTAYECLNAFLNELAATSADYIPCIQGVADCDSSTNCCTELTRLNNGIAKFNVFVQPLRVAIEYENVQPFIDIMTPYVDALRPIMAFFLRSEEIYYGIINDGLEKQRAANSQVISNAWIHSPMETFSRRFSVEAGNFEGHLEGMITDLADLPAISNNNSLDDDDKRAQVIAKAIHFVHYARDCHGIMTGIKQVFFDASSGLQVQMGAGTARSRRRL